MLFTAVCVKCPRINKVYYSELKMSQKVIIKSENGGWICFENPIRVLRADDIGSVGCVIEQASKAAAGGKYAVGFVCYEASTAFDASLHVKESLSPPLPLAWFGVYDGVKDFSLPCTGAKAEDFDIDWQSDTNTAEYDAAIGKIKGYIKNGYTYQVNYTIRLNARFKYEPLEFFAVIANNCDAGYCCFIETDDFAVCSFSPELFFTLKDARATTRPIKGTAARGLTSAADKTAGERLAHSEKDMAENVMIVDMIRNDLGKIALPWTVEVPRMFAIEKYPTLYQMSSTVTAEVDVDAGEVFKRMFPCASITGAPKCRTMEIIAELEKSPRGIYTGAIGYFAPNGETRFNVAIRTVAVDKAAKMATYGVGGGIVWDSTAKSEYDECMTKAKVLTAKNPEFSLLESILWTPQGGFYLERLHLRRLGESADYFDYKFDESRIVRKLHEAVKNCGHGEYKVRLQLAKDGAVSIDTAPITPAATPLKLKIADKNVNSGDVFLYHKTTNRLVYEQAYSRRDGCDEVLLWNEKGEITECTFHNIAFEKDGILYTPPVDCGLLAGTMRQEMLQNGRLIEKRIRVDEVGNFDAIFLLNSVRGKRNAIIA